MATEQFQVVVVHADTGTHSVLMQLLRSMARIQLHAAHNGGEAVQVALRVLPQLVLLDPHLPGMDGFATIVALRAHGIHCPVTALIDDDGPSEEYWLAQGFGGVIPLAHGPEQIRACIAAWLDEELDTGG